MAQFSYVARNSEGKLIEGMVQANDRAAAIFQIEQLRCVPIKIEPMAAASAKSNDPAGSSGRAQQSQTVQTLPLTQQFLFTEQLGHLLSAGMTLDEALGILVQRLKQPKLQSLSKSLHKAIIDGRSLSQALRDFPKIFSSLYINMVSAGEAIGTLPEILRRLVVHLADVKAMRDRVQQALVYPAVLVVAGIGLVIVFMTVMVPKLTDFFTQTGQQLPLPTRILVGGNHIIVGYWWLVLAIGAGLYALWKVYTRTPDGRKSWDYFCLHIPGYGQVQRERFNAQFARTLGTLVENGVTLLKALELLEDISGNEWIRQKMVMVRASVVDGASLSNALRLHKIFPELMLDMMAVGEQTGRFGETMQMIANVYERELDKQIKIISALIPPVIMIVIASVVGLVVFGILSAVFNLTAGLKTKIH
jgi:type II secretory pathway component PulF